jgi:hypothetical protein
MQEKPILFSGPMIRAILDGTKTQSRRVIKPQPDVDCRLSRLGDTDLWTYTLCDREWRCPYGIPGDISVYRMPRWASRINLEITDARVERLNDITEEDCIAEGVGHGFQMNAGYPDYQHIKNGACELTQDTAYASFWSLWDSINGKKHPWSSNPWVWVVVFKLLTD